MGHPRGFCFVEMANDAEAQRAIAAVNGKELSGRKLNVNEARPKADRASGVAASPAGKHQMRDSLPTKIDTALQRLKWELEENEAEDIRRPTVCQYNSLAAKPSSVKHL
jgi:RNA recognition motif-containing protein